MKIFPLAILAVSACIPVVGLAADDTDRRIEQAARDTYNYRTVLNDTVHVDSSHGVVTLTGVVQDREEKDLAEDTVANLPGVVRVADQITVVPISPERSDGWITFKLRTILLVKTSVSATSTTVQVSRGVVTLEGTATSEAQKDLTAIYAREIDGVTEVRNQLVVANASRPGTPENIDDASITGQLKDELATGKATHALKVKVISLHGAVTLTGETISDFQKNEVTRLAQSVRGVHSVDNRMTVKR